MSELCKEKVSSGPWGSFCQCSRSAKKDGYCTIHHPDYIAEKRRKQEEAYEEKKRNSTWYRLERAQEEIAELKAEIEQLKAAK